MKRAILFLSIVTLIAAGCNQQPASQAPAAASSSTANAAASGPFTAQELTQFAALDPIDTHTHLYQSAPVLTAMLRRLNLRVVDILVTHDPDQKLLDQEKSQALQFVRSSDGYAVLCTTFNPFPYADPGFSRKVIAQLNQDFDHGAIAVKIWKNIGEQVKDKKGGYVLPATLPSNRSTRI